MTTAVDTNVLVYAHMPSFPQHEHARAFLHECLAHGGMVITPSILHEVVHIITDPRRFDPPVSMNEAVGLAQRYLQRTNVTCLSVDEEALRLAFELLEQHRLGCKRIADTLFAATLLRNGVRRLATYDADDFRVSGLELVIPAPASSARGAPRP